MQRQEIMPASNIPPLSSDVTLSTLVSMVAFAIKDRQCRPVPEDTTPRMHPNLMLPAYTNCMYESTATECDATISDLRTMRTLMERNPRLTEIADFATVQNRIDEGCRRQGRNVLSKGIVRPWPSHRLRQCPRTIDQPVLISSAIVVRPPIELLKRSGDPLIEWVTFCRMAKGYVFLRDHCLNSGKHPYFNAATGEPLAPENYKKLGIESYYCSYN